MLPITTSIPNSFTIKHFVGLGDVESELIRNPSAKLFREIELTIGIKDVVIALSSVTKEAASGGYRNGAINNVSSIMSTESFMASDDVITHGALSAESYSVINKILQIRKEVSKYRPEVERVLEILATV